jgi:CRP-like cAMP-binding protein
VKQPTARRIARLSPAELEALLAYGARATWPAGFVVYQRGSPADGVFVVLRGRVVLRSRVKAGRGFVPGIACEGETFGSEGLGPDARYVTDARAEDQVETLHLSGNRFRALVRELPQAALSLMGQVMAERTVLLDKLRELTTMSVEQRLITALLRLSSSQTFTKPDGSIELCAQRYRVLCEMVGATRESVSLVLGRLVGEGLVRRDGNVYVVSADAALAERLGGRGDALVLVGDTTAAEQAMLN